MSDEVDPQRAFRQAERYFGYKGPDVLMREGRDYPKIHPGVSAFNREMKKKAGLHKKGRNLPVGFLGVVDVPNWALEARDERY